MKRVYVEFFIALVIFVWSVCNWIFWCDFLHAFLPLTISGIIQSFFTLIFAGIELEEESNLS